MGVQTSGRATSIVAKIPLFRPTNFFDTTAAFAGMEMKAAAALREASIQSLWSISNAQSASGESLQELDFV